MPWAAFAGREAAKWHWRGNHSREIAGQTSARGLGAQRSVWIVRRFAPGGEISTPGTRRLRADPVRLVRRTAPTIVVRELLVRGDVAESVEGERALGFREPEAVVGLERMVHHRTEPERDRAPLRAELVPIR